MRTDYFQQVLSRLQAVMVSQQGVMEQAAQWIADALASDHLIWVFGASHAGILTEELVYRAGGLVPISPIFIPGLTCDVRPITLTSTLERLDGYAASAVREVPIQAGDVLIVHSVSGRNAAPVEVALYGKERGARVIALTSLDYSQSVSPRSKTGKRLFEVADLVIDNGAPRGDAVVQLPDFPQPVAPVSTVLGAAILNAIIAEACALLLERGIQPPVFLSANLEGGDAHNARLMSRYRGRVLYL
ncbi:MAG: SIS domain-containing protein [Armatimonadota bacterium]